MSLRVLHNVPSPRLLPNSELFHWKDRIIHLPRNYAKSSLECKQGFVEILKNLDIFSLRPLNEDQKKQAFDKAWEELSKTLPKETFARAIGRIIEIAGMAFIVIFTARACL